MNQQQSKDPIKTAFDDWAELLKHTKNEHMLKDPYDVWLEAFTVATMLERHGTIHALQTQLQVEFPASHDARTRYTRHDVEQLQMGLIKKAVALIASKGMQR